MHFSTLIAGFALATAVAAQADPVGKLFNATHVAACAAEEDALAVVLVAEDDASKGLELFRTLATQDRCGSYEGIFVIDDVIVHEAPFWVLQVTTLKYGKLFIIYTEPTEKSTETVQLNLDQQGRR